MFIKAKSLDDLLYKVLSKLVKSSHGKIKPTRGAATEKTGVLLQISNPRARISRTEKKGIFFSCLGELLWYLAGSNRLSYIGYYIPKYKNESEDGVTIFGAYGPRLMGKNKNGVNQIENILALLKEKPESRRAVIQLFDADDLISANKEIPCTCTLQFILRGRRLDMLTNMRSNDAYVGLPHDVFAFTMIQEIIARALDVEVGVYKHAVGSLHLYETNRQDAIDYLEEGWQEIVEMPAMPIGDPFVELKKLQRVECAIRNNRVIDVKKVISERYWADLARLLQIFQHSKSGETKEIKRLKKQMESKIYDQYIDKKRRASVRKHVVIPTQAPLFEPTEILS